jgi:hypothetical protein
MHLQTERFRQPTREELETSAAEIHEWADRVLENLRRFKKASRKAKPIFVGARVE